MGKYKAGSSVSYGTGSYDSQAHGGYGKGQTKLSGTAGEEKGATKHAPKAIERDGIEGQGDRTRGYQMDAHTGLHHGKKGQALGHPNDLHMDYDAELYSEGRPLAGEHNNPGFTRDGGHGHPSKAQHHPKPDSTPDKFQKIADEGAHSFRYAGETKKGFLRLSGHKGAHMVGKR